MITRGYSRLLVAIGLLLVTLACSMGGAVPPSSIPTQSGPFPAAPTAASVATSEAAQPPTLVPLATLEPTQSLLPQVAPQLVERRLVVMEWPPRIRVGDGDRLRLTLLVDSQGHITPTVETAGHQVSGQEITIPDLYDTDNLVVEARLDLAGVPVEPQGVVSQPMLRGQPLTFYWSIRPEDIGILRGTLWVYLVMVPRDGSPVQRQPLLALPVNIEAISVLGVPANVARWGGVVGASLSAVLGFPFLEKILQAFWRAIGQLKL
jgi:hypothetical protein